MRSFIDRLPKRLKVGLVQFSDTSERDRDPDCRSRARARRPRLSEADSGTAIGIGLLTAVKLVQTSLASDGVVRMPGKSLPAAIVLLSDGKQTQGRVQPLAAAATASAAGIPVDTVALGTRHGVLGVGAFAPKVPPDPPLMRAIARADGWGDIDGRRLDPARLVLPRGREQHRPRDRVTPDRVLVCARSGGAPARRGRLRPRLGRGVSLGLSRPRRRAASRARRGRRSPPSPRVGRRRARRGSPGRRRARAAPRPPRAARTALPDGAR